MSPSFFEIVQLSNGDYALKRVDDDSAPLVQISFSQEARELMEKRALTVARAMSDAGIQGVGQINDAVEWEDADPEDFEPHAHHTLH